MSPSTAVAAGLLCPAVTRRTVGRCVPAPTELDGSAWSMRVRESAELVAVADRVAAVGLGNGDNVELLAGGALLPGTERSPLAGPGGVVRASWGRLDVPIRLDDPDTLGTRYRQLTATRQTPKTRSLRIVAGCIDPV